MIKVADSLQAQERFGLHHTLCNEGIPSSTVSLRDVSAFFAHSFEMFESYPLSSFQ